MRRRLEQYGDFGGCRLRFGERRPKEAGDPPPDGFVYSLLGRPRRLERSLRHEQRVIAILHDVKRRWRAHTLPHALQKVERAERVARSLQEQDGRLKLQQDLVTKLRSVAGAAKR